MVVGNNIMNKKILVILLITIVAFIGIPQVQANKNIFNNFTKLYNVPNVSDSKLNTCKTCMASTAPKRNMEQIWFGSEKQFCI